MQQQLRDQLAKPAIDAPPTLPSNMRQLVVLILADYFQSKRILIEWGSAFAVAAMLMRNSTNTHDLMATWSIYTVLVALYTTSVLADIAEQPFQLQRLLAIQSRRAYINAYLIAANVIVLSCYIIVVSLSYVIAPLARPSLELLGTSFINLVVLTSLVTTLMLMLTPLVANSHQRILVLLSITMPFSWNILGPAIQHFIGPNYSKYIAACTTFFGVVLWPSLHLYTTIITPHFDRVMMGVIVFHLIIIMGIIRQITIWFNKKSLKIA